MAFDKRKWARERRKWRYANEPGYAEKRRADGAAYKLRHLEKVREKARIKQKLRRERHPEKVKEGMKRWREKNREYRNEYNRNWQKAHPEHRKKYRDKNRDKRLAYQRAWYKKNSDHVNSRIKIYREAHKEQHTTYVRERKRRIRLEAAGRPKPSHCECCGEKKKRLVFDHCHVTGHFRGWICDHCNSMIGFARDEIAKLEAGIAYLRRFNDSISGNQIFVQGSADPPQIQ